MRWLNGGESDALRWDAYEGPGGQPFSRGHLYQLLSNPIYVGQVAHKSARYAGRHDAIIDEETFDAVQRQLKDNAPARALRPMTRYRAS